MQSWSDQSSEEEAYWGHWGTLIRRLLHNPVWSKLDMPHLEKQPSLRLEMTESDASFARKQVLSDNLHNLCDMCGMFIVSWHFIPVYISYSDKRPRGLNADAFLSLQQSSWGQVRKLSGNGECFFWWKEKALGVMIAFRLSWAESCPVKRVKLKAFIMDSALKYERYIFWGL